MNKSIVNLHSFLAGRGGYHYLFGVAREYGNVVMSKHKLARIGLIDLPSNHYESRSALVVKALALNPYYVAGTHLTFEDTPEMETVRVEAIDKIVGYIKAKRLQPVMLMGDLNSPADGKVVARLRKHGFVVTNDTVPGELSWPADRPEILLDYIACYPADRVEIINHRVVDEPQVSDHRPVFPTIKFNEKKE